MNTFSTPIILPIVSIQHDFQTVISDVKDNTVAEEAFWVSCYKTGQTSVHGKVHVSLAERADALMGDRAMILQSKNGIQFEKANGGNFTVSCPSLSIPSTKLRVPRRIVQDPEVTSKITAFSIAPDHSQMAVGYEDGTIRRLPVVSSSTTPEDSPVQPFSYNPHLSRTSVTSLEYFPSSRVLLSGGMDFTLHILDASPDLSPTSPANPARTFKGHIRSITDTAMVSRGRNILSCAKDGTTRLWDVPSGSQIRIFGSQAYSPINSMSLGDKPAHWTDLQAPNGEAADTTQEQVLDTREVDTAGKIFFTALQDGHFEGHDLRSKASFYHSSSSSMYQRLGSLSSVSYSMASSLVATGSTRGVVSIFDIRKLPSTLCSFQRNNSAIGDLTFVLPSQDRGDKGLQLVGDLPSQVCLAIATEDGLPYLAGVRPDGPEVLAELTCGECDAVRHIRSLDSGEIWTASEDGIIRMYLKS